MAKTREIRSRFFALYNYCIGTLRKSMKSVLPLVSISSSSLSTQVESVVSFTRHPSLLLSREILSSFFCNKQLHEIGPCWAHPTVDVPTYFFCLPRSIWPQVLVQAVSLRLNNTEHLLRLVHLHMWYRELRKQMRYRKTNTPMDKQPRNCVAYNTVCALKNRTSKKEERVWVFFVRHKTQCQQNYLQD